MPQRPKPGFQDHQTDPFDGVDARSVTDIEQDEKVRLEREPLPAAARLTDLPLKWVLIALLICIGVGELAQRVERKHLINKAEDTNLLTQEEAEAAREGNEMFNDRERIRERMLEVRKRQRAFREDADRLRREHPLQQPTEEPPPTAAPQPVPEPEATALPLTLESIRAEVARIAGDNYESYRRLATLAALLIGGLGLILMAVFVRLLAALLVGGVVGTVAFFLGLETWIVAVSAGAGALLGAALAPRLLLANMLVNVTLAGTILGGTLLGGGVYLATSSELYSIFGLGGGVVLGAIIGFKFSRQLFLTAVLVNAAGFATLLLWMAWGELFPHFWPVTFGGLMILDAIATRIYHKVRWERA